MNVSDGLRESVRLSRPPAVHSQNRCEQNEKDERGYYLRFSVDNVGRCRSNHDHDQHQRAKIGEPRNEQPNRSEEFGNSNNKVEVVRISPSAKIWRSTLLIR